MRKALTRRLTYSNVVATVCLFVTLGGGAYAATTGAQQNVVHGCVDSAGQLTIRGSGTQACPRHQHALTFDKAGRPGPVGPRGDTGPTGATGATGPTGPSHVYTAAGNLVSIAGSSSVTVASVNVPAGEYSIAATLYIRGENVGSFETNALCTVSAGSDSNFDQVTLGSTGGFDVNVPASLLLTHTFSTPGTITLACNGSAGSGGTVDADSAVIAASLVGAVN
jgi:hypothetical protein